MWILKGTLLGLWLFGFGTMFYLYFAVFRPLTAHSAVAFNLITSQTTQNPLWWVALVVCLVFGYAIAHRWSGPLTLWIALLLTGLVPAGYLALVIMLAARLKHVSQSHL
jgi:CHASE2 domain-containing sensor protein